MYNIISMIESISFICTPCNGLTFFYSNSLWAPNNIFQYWKFLNITQKSVKKHKTAENHKVTLPTMIDLIEILPLLLQV